MINDLMLDTTGKSDAFFFKKNISSIRINKKKVINLLNKKSKSKDIRLCLHSTKKSQGQCMINLINKKKFYYPHFHNFSDEYYIILSGGLKLFKFTKSLKLKEKTIINTKNIFLSKVKKGEIHITTPLQKKCIYIEFRSGNFLQHKNTYINKKFYTKDLDKI